MPETPLTILHFNDVYEIAQRATEPVGGAARFSHLCARLRAEAAEAASAHGASDGAAATATGDAPVLVLFSGDALSPSLMSTVTRGTHMIPVLNAIAPAAAVLGNHEGDCGFDNFERIAAQHTFPWLVSNARLKADGQPLGRCKEFAVLRAGAWTVGCMGLIEREWLETLATLSPDAVEYEDFASAARRMHDLLRNEHGCDVVIALTHMRIPNDLRLANAGIPLDMILGGHDHTYFVHMPGDGRVGVPVIKSACDFRTLSRIRVSTHTLTAPAFAPADARIASVTGAASPPALRYHMDITRYDVTSSEPEDAAVQRVVQQYADVLGRKMEAVIGVTRVPLDVRFSAVRTQETNVGNFVADLMRQAIDADVALVNSGTLRTDAIVGPGILRMKDLVTMLPMQDTTVKLQMPGRLLLAALENAVSAWPKMEGRFCQVSGVRFHFDARCAPGHRILRDTVMIQARRSAEDSSGEDGTPGATRSGQDYGAAGEAWGFGDQGSRVVRLHGSLGTPQHTAGSSDLHISITSVPDDASHPVTHMVRAESEPNFGSADPTRVPHVAETARSHRPHRLSAVKEDARTPVESPSVVWEPLDLERRYSVATKSYMATGKDGFDCFCDPEVHVLMSDEECPILQTLVRNHFRILAALSGFGSMDLAHPQSLVNSRRYRLSRQHTSTVGADTAPPDTEAALSPPSVHVLSATHAAPAAASHTFNPSDLRVESPVGEPLSTSDMDPNARSATMIAEAAARAPWHAADVAVDVSTPAARPAPPEIVSVLRHEGASNVHVVPLLAPPRRADARAVSENAASEHHHSLQDAARRVRGAGTRLTLAIAPRLDGRIVRVEAS